MWKTQVPCCLRTVSSRPLKKLSVQFAPSSTLCCHTVETLAEKMLLTSPSKGSRTTRLHTSHLNLLQRNHLYWETLLVSDSALPWAKFQLWMSHGFHLHGSCVTSLAKFSKVPWTRGETFYCEVVNEDFLAPLAQTLWGDRVQLKTAKSFSELRTCSNRILSFIQMLFEVKTLLANLLPYKCLLSSVKGED